MKKKKTLKSSKSRAASPSSIAERTTLSKDVIMEIFSRLPTKSLCILSCYWIGYNDKYDNTKIDAIVSFDLGKEEFSTVVLPEGRFDPAGVRFLVELKGLLCLVDSPEDVSSMDIWVLKDSKNHIWAKEYIIDLSMFDFGFDFITPLDCKEGKILMDVKFESLEWYDVEKKCFKKIDNLTSRRWRWSVLFTDGLFSLGSRYVGSV
ncbi:hypothetical protein KY290_030883 [Solanum tuberosum]|uniref:F-box associated beta-propeller type 3 domain-containing protein n=1 Tax=Solanum tuberosum TaxID=4113 RepID=A0ABQ7U7R7_SOLTU|nr:hypothetical protein KY289_030121 [Solanum tuberosum]KAH0742890.1 hypothetical protein KY290_030883 [Solanum tuberosum]